MSLLSWVGKKIGLTDGKFWSLFYGGETWAGEPVSLDTAMQVGAFAGCVKLYAETISTLPLGLYEKQKDGTRKSRNDLDIWRVVAEEPNADQDAPDYWSSSIAWLQAMGNSFSEKHYKGDQLIALELLNPNYSKLERTDSGFKQLRYHPPSERERIIPESRLFHLRGLSFGADLGLSTVDLSRQSLGSARATDKAASSHFANGMRPGGWLVYKGGGILEDDQRERARQELINPLTGSGNFGKTGILEGDFDYRALAVAPEAAQLLESRRFSVEDVCRWFGVPPILLSHASQGQTMWGTGIEQIVLGWYVLQLRPRMVRLEKAMRRQLLSPAEKRQQNLYFEYNAEGLLRGDSAARAEMYWKMVQVAATTPNQICDRENLPRFPGGDRHFINSTLVPLDDEGIPIKAAQPAPPEPQQQPPAVAARRLEVVQ